MQATGWCVDRPLSSLGLFSALCSSLPAGVEKSETFFPAVSEHLAAVSGVCPWMGGPSVSSQLPRRAFKDCWRGGRGSLLKGDFLCCVSYLLPGRKGETKPPSEFKLNALLGWCRISDFIWLTILIALLGVAGAFCFYVNRKASESPLALLDLWRGDLRDLVVLLSKQNNCFEFVMTL